MRRIVKAQNIKKAQGGKLLCLCLMGGVLIAGISMPSTASAQSSTEMNNRLSRIENELQTLSRAVYRGETPENATIANANSDRAAADAVVRIQQLEGEIRTLTGKIEQQGFDLQQIQTRLDALEQDSRLRFEALEKNNQAAPLQPQPTMMAPPTGQPSPPPTFPIAPAEQPAFPSQQAMQTPPESLDPAATMDAASLYERGFSEVKAENFAAAQTTFESFLKTYPDHALASNALYWLGETFYVREQFSKAARVFAQAYQKYPNGPKAADNLLKLGMALAGDNKKAEACVALAELRKKYPNGPAPVLARGDQEMKTLGCP